jgi:hypothetical protein
MHIMIVHPRVANVGENAPCMALMSADISIDASRQQSTKSATLHLLSVGKGSVAEPEPKRDAAPAATPPTMVLNMVRS